METMDFEEISDGELEEDIKTSGKGLGDALGVDWESLVKETQPRRAIASSQEKVQRRWQCKAVFQRIGISAKYAGPDFTAKLAKKYSEDGENSAEFFLSDIAMIHTALSRQKLLQQSSDEVFSIEDTLYR